MCGITGFYGLENKELLRRMSKVITHRGPDGKGYFTDGKVSLAHRRLSIIDLESGQQPMFNEDESVVITFNGEIYNFKELRKKLEGKHQFKTKCDTEVIIHAYEEYGFDCVKHLNGMFAFAIWDKNKKILFLARDRLGIKPLYYYYDNEKFLFSSEIKSILQDDSIKREVNEEALIDYFTFQNIVDEKTLFKGIKTLLPGNYLVVDEKGLSTHQYWDASYKKEFLKNKNSKNNYKEYLRKFSSVFKESMQRHLISDVPLGTYLSGGFDSGSVTTLASELNKEQLKTFTGTFKEGGKYDETKCSREVAKKSGAEIHEALIEPKHFIKYMEKIVYHLDEPKVGIPAISQYMVSKLVSEHVKVVLTGHAGDELFAGYPVYKVAYLKDLIKKNPLNIFKALSLFKLSEIPRSLYFIVFPFFDKEVREGVFIMFNERQRKKLFNPKFYAKYKKYSPVSTIDKYVQGKNLTYTDKVQHLYLKTYLPSLLVIEDKMGMAHSIEARTPLCDNELVEYATSISMKYKLHNNELKYIIKESMKSKLPSVLYSQPKKGFPTPFSLWVRGELKDYLYDLLLGERARARDVFNMDYVKSLLDKHCNIKRDTLFDLVNAARIWSLVNIELWFRLFIDGDDIKFSLDKLK